MSDQGNEYRAVETGSAEEVEGHMRPKWHAIEEEPPAVDTESAEEVEGHMRAQVARDRGGAPGRRDTDERRRRRGPHAAQVALITRPACSARDCAP